jgi:hypothetical protein
MVHPTVSESTKEVFDRRIDLVLVGLSVTEDLADGDVPAHPLRHVDPVLVGDPLEEGMPEHVGVELEPLGLRDILKRCG